jgi:hypothetical protein
MTRSTKARPTRSSHARAAVTRDAATPPSTEHAQPAPALLSSPTTMAPADPAPVPLGTGPPTHAELRAHYPAKFTWEQLRTFINAGDLGLLKRDKRLQQRCARVRRAARSC